MTRLFGTTIFLSALLLFSVQPMVGKMVLPRFGGTPGVWNTCMVVYQALLLAGYAYSHFSCKWLGVQKQLLLHLAVLVIPLFALPIAFSQNVVASSSINPTGWLLVQLLAVVGLPFFSVATTSPLIQSWLHQSRFRNADDPYYLYAIGNAGSLLALLGYPLLVEPYLPLAQQSVVWSALYFILVILITTCGLSVWRSSQRTGDVVEEQKSNAEERREVITAGQRLRWLALALVPSSLMIGVTTHITTDIASIPLLWVLPLALYLLTFVLTFSRRTVIPHRWMIRLFHYIVLPLAFLVLAKFFHKEWLVILVHLTGFFVIAMVCHGELAHSRPDASNLTEFYLWVSFGGVLGGCINAIFAPMLFNSIAEYPLMLVFACLLAPSLQTSSGNRRIAFGDLGWPCLVAAMAAFLAWLMSTVRLGKELEVGIQIGVPAVMCLFFKNRPIRFTMGVVVILLASAHYAHGRQGQKVYAARGFFGVNRVTIDPRGQYHQLLNGRTFHGVQKMFPEPSNEPLSYYHRTGPLGDVFASLNDDQERAIAVIGLGIGATASYVKPGQKVTFFEINPDVRDIAQNDSLFTHLRDCRGTYEIVIGDARIQLEQLKDRSFDILVIDAFSSDSIPAHLISIEAVQLYLQRLSEDGVLVVHISNKFLRLEPLLAQLAKQLDLVGISRRDPVYDDSEHVWGKSSSHYVVLARRESDLRSLTERADWERLKADSDIKVWTDDYSNLLSLFVW